MTAVDLATITPRQAWMRMRAAYLVLGATEGGYALIVAAECLGLDLDVILAPILDDLKDALDVRLADLTRIAAQATN